MAAILEAFPHAAAALRNLGFELVDHRFFRRTVARSVTLRQACTLKGKDIGEVLAALEASSEAQVVPVLRDLSAPVAQWIACFPQTRAIFASYGLDACCGGSHPVAEAAAKLGSPWAASARGSSEP